jgi:hypothetical protein
MDDRVENLVLYAWVGEDEHGSGEVGIKQAHVPAGCIPLVSIDEDKISADYIQEQLHQQGKQFGKTIRLCRFKFDGEVIRLEPERK